MATPCPQRPPPNPGSAELAMIVGSLIVLLTLLPLSLRGAQGTKVFALHSGDPAAVVEALRGLYGDQATLVLAQNRLVVRADERIIEQIGDEAIIAPFSRPDARFMPLP